MSIDCDMREFTRRWYEKYTYRMEKCHHANRLWHAWDHEKVIWTIRLRSRKIHPSRSIVTYVRSLEGDMKNPIAELINFTMPIDCDLREITRLWYGKYACRVEKCCHTNRLCHGWFYKKVIWKTAEFENATIPLDLVMLEITIGWYEEYACRVEKCHHADQLWHAWEFNRPPNTLLDSSGTSHVTDRRTGGWCTCTHATRRSCYQS